MLQFKKNLLIAFCAIFTFSACKNSNSTTTEAAVSTTATASTPTPAAATLAAKLTKFNEVAAPFVLGAKTDLKSLTPLTLTPEEMENFEKEYGLGLNEDIPSTTTHAFRVKISETRQIVGVIYNQESASKDENLLALRVFENDGTPVGKPVSFLYEGMMSNAYSAGSINIEITIAADKITTKGTSTEIDPMGEKDDKVTEVKPTTTVITAGGFSN